MANQSDHTHCTFCDLIHGAAEVSICHEDADAIAFMDIQPVNNGHVLVVPREHYESLLDVPQQIGMHLFQVTMRLANAVRQVTGINDLNIVVNSGSAAGQDEPHYHVHIIPRREGDGFDIPLPFNGSEMPDRTLLDAYAARIGLAMSDSIKGAGGSSGPASKHSEAHKITGDLPKPAARKAEHRAAADDEQPADIRARAGERVEQRAAHDEPLERAVAVPTFNESGEVNPSDVRVSGAKPPRRLRVDEGAHGELTYDAFEDTSDAA